MALEEMYLPIALTLGALFLAGTAFYVYYRRHQKRKYKHRLKQLSQEINKELERRGARHPQLIENKLASAEEHWRNGNYKKAAKLMEDLLNVVRLS